MQKLDESAAVWGGWRPHQSLVWLLILVSAEIWAQAPNAGIPDFNRIAAGNAPMPRYATPVPIPERREMPSSERRAAPDLRLLRSLVHDASKISTPKATPVPGLYQVAVDNEVFYISADGRYLLRGEMLDLQSRRNLTEQSASQLRKTALAQIPDADFIHYPSASSHYAVTVFLDTDCAYCRVVHENLENYNRLGISVRIAAFPRSGLNSAAFQRAVSIWCSDNRQQAFARAVNGQALGNAKCKSPVKREYLAGLRMGVNGTPTFVLDDGSLIAGYVAPENLLRILRAQQASP